MWPVDCFAWDLSFHAYSTWSCANEYDWTICRPNTQRNSLSRSIWHSIVHCCLLLLSTNTGEQMSTHVACFVSSSASLLRWVMFPNNVDTEKLLTCILCKLTVIVLVRGEVQNVRDICVFTEVLVWLLWVAHVRHKPWKREHQTWTKSDSWLTGLSGYSIQLWLAMTRDDGRHAIHERDGWSPTYLLPALSLKGHPGLRSRSRDLNAVVRSLVKDRSTFGTYLWNWTVHFLSMIVCCSYYAPMECRFGFENLFNDSMCRWRS